MVCVRVCVCARARVCVCACARVIRCALIRSKINPFKRYEMHRALKLNHPKRMD
jgi:hypothetical protein